MAAGAMAFATANLLVALNISGTPFTIIGATNKINVHNITEPVPIVGVINTTSPTGEVVLPFQFSDEFWKQQFPIVINTTKGWAVNALQQMNPFYGQGLKINWKSFPLTKEYRFTNTSLEDAPLSTICFNGNCLVRNFAIAPTPHIWLGVVIYLIMALLL